MKSSGRTSWKRLTIFHPRIIPFNNLGHLKTSFRYLTDATHHFPLGPITDSAIDTFLLQMLDYDELERVVDQRLDIGFFVCSQKSLCEVASWGSPQTR